MSPDFTFNFADYIKYWSDKLLSQFRVEEPPLGGTEDWNVSRGGDGGLEDMSSRESILNPLVQDEPDVVLSAEKFELDETDAVAKKISSSSQTDTRYFANFGKDDRRQIRQNSNGEWESFNFETTEHGNKRNGKWEKVTPEEAAMLSGSRTSSGSLTVTGARIGFGTQYTLSASDIERGFGGSNISEVAAEKSKPTEEQQKQIEKVEREQKEGEALTSQATSKVPDDPELPPEEKGKPDPAAEYNQRALTDAKTRLEEKGNTVEPAKTITVEFSDGSTFSGSEDVMEKAIDDGVAEVSVKQKKDEEGEEDEGEAKGATSVNTQSRYIWVEVLVEEAWTETIPNPDWEPYSGDNWNWDQEQFIEVEHPARYEQRKESNPNYEEPEPPIKKTKPLTEEDTSNIEVALKQHREALEKQEEESQEIEELKDEVNSAEALVGYSSKGAKE